MKKGFHIGDAIRKELTIQDRSIAWLARNIDGGFDKDNLCKALKKPHLKPELLYKICNILKKDFFVLYSRELTEKQCDTHYI